MLISAAMSTVVIAMLGAGVSLGVAGFVFVRPRWAAASGAGRLLVLGPIFEASALAAFAAEHFCLARGMVGMVPKWVPAPLFWTYFIGVALLAAAVSLVIWRSVRWSSSLLAVLFLTFVITLDLPNLPTSLHDRFFWVLTFRETSFASAVLVLAGSLWPAGSSTGAALMRVGRTVVAGVFVFYGIEHLLFTGFVVGVPLQKTMPAWVPAPTLLTYLVGLVLIGSGLGLLFRRTARLAAASAGSMLVLVTALLYVPILLMELHAPLALEGTNYVFDTLLFAGTAFLAGFGAD